MEDFIAGYFNLTRRAATTTT